MRPEAGRVLGRLDEMAAGDPTGTFTATASRPTSRNDRLCAGISLDRSKDTVATYSDGMTVAIVEVLYSDITQLDFTGPHTVFTRIPGTEVIVASAAGGEITSDDGLRFAGTVPLSEVRACDVLSVPGGMGAVAASVGEVLIDHLRRLAGTARYVTSVCTGSLVLGTESFGTETPLLAEALPPESTLR
ncbi:MAG: DJ/PfpI family protein [Pseudonocardiales bacterium]|nr:DJ/PfpI family protein [Pseudonocardiales bacterium]